MLGFTIFLLLTSGVFVGNIAINQRKAICERGEQRTFCINQRIKKIDEVKQTRPH